MWLPSKYQKYKNAVTVKISEVQKCGYRQNIRSTKMWLPSKYQSHIFFLSISNIYSGNFKNLSGKNSVCVFTSKFVKLAR